MKRKPINEHFFDEESKEMMYFLGVSFSRYSASSTDNRNTWTSSSIDLLGLVQKALETTQSIGRPNKWKSRNFQVRSQHLQDKLKQYGLGIPRSKREFPCNIEEQYLDHFVRGIFDGNVSAAKSYVDIPYPSEKFLQQLYPLLVLHANIRSGRRITRPYFRLIGSDITSVRKFIYRDWDYIQECGIYLLSKKERFITKIC